MANEYEPYENLANAIVVLAAKDYRVALRKRKRHPGSHEAQYRVSKLEGFFRSEWYGILTDVDGEYEAAIAKAEADKQVAITNAEAEAQKTAIAADAQAEANRKLAESLSDTLIDYQKVQKWDGKLPTVSGGNALVSIDSAE